MTRTTIRAIMLAVGLLSASPVAASRLSATPVTQTQWVQGGWRARPMFGPRHRRMRRWHRRRFVRGAHRRVIAGYWGRRYFRRGF